MNRRTILAGLFASGLAPLPSWADAGNPAYIAAGRLTDGRYALIGLSEGGEQKFLVPLPDRGHAAAGHPTRPEAVAFARRPGNFAIVIDCLSGQAIAELETPHGCHFYGHGVFSRDGRYLFTTENDFESGEGQVGVWNAQAEYARVGQFASQGIGPHEIRLMPDGRSLVVANGGIDTHPESGRSKLNLPTMQPNLTYLTLDGTPLETVEPPADWHRQSLRHLAVAEDGTVAVACQWQGDITQSPPLLATHRRGENLTFHDVPEPIARRMQGYAGSIAFAGDGREIALTGPRGGLAILFSRDGDYLRRVEAEDVCGVAATEKGLIFTTGTGRVLTEKAHLASLTGIQWDNHLVRV